MYRNNEIDINYVSTNNMMANILTKNLTKMKHVKCSKEMNFFLNIPIAKCKGVSAIWITNCVATLLFTILNHFVISLLLCLYPLLNQNCLKTILFKNPDRVANMKCIKKGIGWNFFDVFIPNTGSKICNHAYRIKN